MKIAIIGTGGVGGYFGARLQAAGNELSYLARGEHKSVLEKNGLTLKSVKGDLHLKEVKVFDSLVKMPEADLVILALKAWQVKDLIPDLKKIMGKKTTLLPLQNGVSTTEELTESIPKEKVLMGLCKIFSFKAAPGVIEHQGVEPTIIFGEANNEKTERVIQINTCFESAGISSFIADDIQAERWKKFIPICLSGLMAVSQCTYGEMRSLPEMRSLMIELLEENWKLAREIGINVSDDLVERAVGAIDTYRFEATSSMARDLWAGRPSELHYQNGMMVQLGKKYGVATPLNRFIFHTLLPRERKARQGLGSIAMHP
jgi:2-dehydropantoate 2-reductase